MPKTVKVEFISTVKTVYDNSKLTAKILPAKDLRELKYTVQPLLPTETEA